MDATGRVFQRGGDPRLADSERSDTDVYGPDDCDGDGELANDRRYDACLGTYVYDVAGDTMPQASDRLNAGPNWDSARRTAGD